MFKHEVLTEGNKTFKYFGEASSFQEDQNQQTKPEYQLTCNQQEDKQSFSGMLRQYHSHLALQAYDPCFSKTEFPSCVVFSDLSTQHSFVFLGTLRKSTVLEFRYTGWTLAIKIFI